MATGHRLLLENARQVVLVCARGERFLAGPALRSLAVLEGASLVVGSDGFIKAIGPADVIQRQFSGETFEERIDCSGKCVLPGAGALFRKTLERNEQCSEHYDTVRHRLSIFRFSTLFAGLVDAHTHPVWAGERVHEFAMKLAGATYMDIHQAGGGINFTVEHTRQASEEELFGSFRQRLQCMMRAGTTLVECKSGYGLNLETELKMLRVIERARRELPLGISATYCGAHSVPKGKTAIEATDDIIHNHLPRLKDLGRNGDLHLDNIDVFCEKGLGAELGAQAISHLEEVSDEGIAAMAAAKCSAVLLPTTAYMLRLKQPRARKMLDEGVIVALGSDFNPNAYCFSMPMVMHLACVNMRMSMPEALAAATINAAYALGKSHTHGSLEVGKQGDVIIINASR
ncbi:hypothetical protein U0070_014127 [Myodes glareolus]|uniref:Probable imidazolonepropionase n=1 Tax=Myodes glareolus TaxID=447135 RepID=A0AAW0JFC2_MYOGA